MTGKTPIHSPTACGASPYEGPARRSRGPESAERESWRSPRDGRVIGSQRSVGAMRDLTRQALAARDGDSSAMRDLVAASYGDVRRLCTVLVDEASAEDLTQETYVRVLRALPRFRGQASARTWMMSIAYRVCMDELRSRTRQRRTASLLVVDEGRVPDPAESVSTYDLIARLDPDRRAALVLTQFWRFSYLEAGAICGCPAGTIRSRVSRARDDLVAHLRSEPARNSRRRSGFDALGGT